jgi:hypothetical protein
MQKTLQDTFGLGATEDATTITLLKAELGLTTTTTTADQFVAATILKAEETLTLGNFSANDDQNLYIVEGFPSTTTKNETSWLVREKVVKLGQPFTAASLNPNAF